MPKCPYCEKEVKPENIKLSIIKGGILRVDKGMFCCPYCDKILGFTSDA